MFYFSDFEITFGNTLFPDAKRTEDVGEGFGGGDFTSDGAEMVEDFAEVFGDEVGRELGGEACANAIEGFE